MWRCAIESVARGRWARTASEILKIDLKKSQSRRIWLDRAHLQIEQRTLGWFIHHNVTETPRNPSSISLKIFQIFGA
jgi:hypothetical protein